MAMAMMRMMEVGGTSPRSTIHSGHYMMSCLDETSDDTDYSGPGGTAVESDHLHQQVYVQQKFQNNVSFRSPEDSKISCFIENNLAELLRYMTLTYNGTLPSPKWKDFKGIKLKLRQKIRLNNIIWREWHMQYIKFKDPVVCQFDVPTCDRTHNKPEAVVLEGKYWKCRLESLAVEYRKWRMHAVQKRKVVRHEEVMQMKALTDDSQLDCFISFIQSYSDEVAQVQTTADNRKFSFSDDSLFPSLTQPFAFPCVKEIAAEARNYFGSEMIVQPGLIQLQPNLPENLTPYDMRSCRPLEGCQRYPRSNPILSSLLTGYSSMQMNNLASVAEKSLSAVDMSSLPFLTNSGMMIAPKSSKPMMPSTNSNSSYAQFSAQDYSVVSDINYVPGNSSLNSMTMNQSDVQANCSNVSFGMAGFQSFNFPVTAACASSPAPTKYLRALLQGHNESQATKDETTSKATDVSSNKCLLPNRRRKSTGQPTQMSTSAHACNKNLQKVIDAERQNNLCRRASTGTLKSTSSEIFAVPQKVQKLKSHSVGSWYQQDVESQPDVRRRKTSCTSRDHAGFVNPQMATSPPCSTNICGTPTLSTGVDKTDVWDIPLISQARCQLEPNHIDCDANSASSSTMTSLAAIGRSTISASVTSTELQQVNDSKQFGSYNDEPMDSTMRHELEHDKQQHVEQRRVQHMSSELKRRISINNGFEKLDELTRGPNENPCAKPSKSAILRKSANFISNMEQENKQTHNEIDSFRKILQELTDELNVIQSSLPMTGCLPAVRPKADLMCEMYNDYVRMRTKANLKFRIFGQLMRPLYESYMQHLPTAYASNMGQAINNWLVQHCSLAILRPAVSNELLEICKKTSLIDNPSKLPQEILEMADSPIICKRD